MPRSSLLTAGLDGLADKSPTIASMLKELYALDDVLQDAHQDAKRDEEHGERVVAAYEAFLQYRERFVKQLEAEKVAVPWQMRMRIDDIELTLRERKLKKEEKQAKTESTSDTESASDERSPEPAAEAQEASAAASDAKNEDPLLLFKAMILPTVFMGVVASLVYFVASVAE